VPEEARAGHRRNIRLQILAICASVQMWEREDRAKSSGLSPKKQKQSTKTKISVREIARRKG